MTLHLELLVGFHAQNLGRLVTDAHDVCIERQHAPFQPVQLGPLGRGQHTNAGVFERVGVNRGSDLLTKPVQSRDGRFDRAKEVA